MIAARLRYRYRCCIFISSSKTIKSNIHVSSRYVRNDMDIAKVGGI